MDAADRLFGEIAVKLGHLSREQLAECIRTQYDSPAGTTLGHIALTLGYMSASDVETVATEQSRSGRKAKPRVGIVEIDATQGGVVEERVKHKDARSASAPPQASRNQARNARTQPNQPPIAAAYRAPSSARIPAARTISDSPPAEPRGTQKPPVEAARPSRRADRTLIGTAPGSAESAPAHEAITVIPPPDDQAGFPEIEAGQDPEVSFESLVSVAPRAPAAAPPTPDAARRLSTPPEASFATLDDSETDFGTLLSQPPKAPPSPPATGTIHGVGAPQLPSPPTETKVARPRAGTLAFASPATPVELAKVTPNADRNTRSGTMQHFRAVTPAQPEDVAASAGNPAPSPSPSTSNERRPVVSLTPTPQGRATSRTPRRASAWFSSLPALITNGATVGASLPPRAALASADLKDAALAQLPTSAEPFLFRAIRAAMASGAQDLHLHRTAPIMTRVHGYLQPLLGGTALGERAVERCLAQVMSDAQWKRLNERGEIMFSLEVPDVGRARVSAFRSEHGCDLVVRTFPTQARGLAELGLPASLAKLLDYESGLIVCTGPIGSGVTTTLGALAGCVVTARQGHVVTLEEIIELRLPSTRCLVSQRQLGTHVNDMARAMRAVAHEDADLVAVGDLRHAEDIALALSLAHGGHLVLAGAHARGAADCLNRLTRPFGKHDQGQARAMLAQSLRAVIAQQLVQRADGNGRVPAIELIVATQSVTDLIRKGAPVDLAGLSSSGKAQKLVPFEDSLQRLAAAGTVDAAEAERVAHNRSRAT